MNEVNEAEIEEVSANQVLLSLPSHRSYTRQKVDAPKIMPHR